VILPAAVDLTRLNLDSPTDVRTFETGKFEVYEVGPATIGRATYEPVSLHILGSEPHAASR
jgi:hypothetical protein